MQPGDILKDRYRLESILGQGAGGTTYLATDLSGGARVALKALTLAGLREWRDFDSLEREARDLASFSHPRVPRSIDSFSIGDGGSQAYVLVREHVPGSSLEEKVAAGWRGTERDIVRVAVGLLGIVADMHALRPPVIHRDINPRNVIAGEDGEVYLVDFGAVLTATPGYTPPEQWSGNATERSDLYACGATILYLLTHRNPADLPRHDMRIDYRRVVKVSPALGWVLDRLLEPDLARRSLEPARAIAILRNGVPPEAAVAADAPPFGSRITVSRDGGALAICVPERGDMRSGIALLGFSGFWLLFVAFWTAMSVAMGAPLLFPLFSVPFWIAGVAMARRGIGVFLSKTLLRIDEQGLRFQRRLLLPGRVSTAPLDALGEVETARSASVEPNTAGARASPPGLVRIQAGAKAFTFGEHLSDAERSWLRDTIREEIALRRG